MSRRARPTDPATACTLPADELRSVLLVRAFEEADEREELLARTERWQATEEARAACLDGATDAAARARFLAQRARVLTESLAERTSAARRLLRVTSVGSLTWLVVAAAAIVGLLSNTLGPSQRVNVIANPLMGLVAWNLAVFVLLFVRTVLLRERLASSGARFAGWVMRLRGRVRQPSASSVTARASAAYLDQWRHHGGPLVASAGSRLLHLGALAMILGSLASMYLRGLVFEYRATWESTFVGADTMAALTSFLFAPASAVTGIEVPGVDALRAMKAPASGEAATWIHLMTATTLLLVVIPRALLAWQAGRTERRLSHALPLDLGAPYYARLFSAGRSVPTRIEVLPYSHGAAAREEGELRTLLQDVFGPRADIRMHPSLDYGTEASAVALGAAGGDGELHCAVVFGLAQTPEIEVHGRFLGELAARLRDVGGVLAFVDGSAYRAKLAGDPDAERRLDERTRAWNLVVRDAGLDPLHVELGARPSAELIERTVAAARATAATGETLP